MYVKLTGTDAITIDVLKNEALIERFIAIDTYLKKYAFLWRNKAFYHLEMAWEVQFPALSGFLRNRSLDQAEQAWLADDLANAPEPFPSLFKHSQALSQLGFYPQRALTRRPEQLMRDIPGRKWQQIQAFSAAIDDAQHWLDWCAGKGHLGRFLAYPQAQSTCLEYDLSLVKSGAQLSQRLNLNAQHHLCDVLTPQVSRYFVPQQHAVALHACGDLHSRLITQSALAQVEHLSVVPCCYNRTTQNNYHGLSQAAQASALKLSKDDLALPLQTTATAGKREIAKRNQSMAWRLAFDVLQRQARQVNEYLNTPPLSNTWWQKCFADWCVDLAALKEIRLPAWVDWDELENTGWQRLAQVRNLELVNKLFQRPLELWLVLDKAIYLQEQGYQVELGQFCDAQLTPRNLLIKASLKKT
ncbi:methyltransferase [Pseudomonas sp. F1_0610]|uniref:methyltransferase n=1 Tax=Pseudomonas sp. F1_0610 TaxID=3114284 RepID=UPI0039C06296